MVISTTCLSYALVSTGMISVAPNLLLFLFPNVGSTEHRGRIMLSLGQALASGALLGDVFLHTLPHMYEEKCFKPATQEDHFHYSSSELRLELTVILGFITFYAMDTIVRLINPIGEHHHGHGHNDIDAVNNEVSKNIKRGRLLSATIILNLLADSLHNFTDGLAIGSTYVASCTHDIRSSHSAQPWYSISYLWRSIFQTRGGVTSFSVMMHEIPHELGDYAILVKHGFSKYEAVALQFVTAIAAFCGTVVGMTAFDSDWTIPFTGGGFLYLSAVNILPEILEENPTGTKKKTHLAIIRLLQFGFFLIGISFMHQVALLEDHHHHHQHHGESDSGHGSHKHFLSDQLHEHTSHNHHGHDHEHYHREEAAAYNVHDEH